MLIARRSAAKLAFAALLLSATSVVALAQANNVVIENLVVADNADNGGKVTYKRIEVTNTNLSKEELTKLFSGEAKKEEAAALIKKMKADRISIPEAQRTHPEGTITARDFLATRVNEGRIASLTLKGVEGKGKINGGDLTFKAGALDVQDFGLGSAVSALSGGDIGDGVLRIGKLTFAGLEATVPEPKLKADAPGGNLHKISMGPLTMENSYDGDLPLKGKMELKSIVIEPPKASEFGKAIATFGYDKLNLSLVASGEYDKAKKTYNLDNFTIAGVNAGALGFKVLLGGLEPAAFTGTKNAKMAGLMGGDFSNLSIRYDNAGLFEKAVAFFAQQQKKSPDALKKEWAGMATMMLPMVLGGDPGALKLAGAVGKFIESPKNITISAKAKGGPLKFGDFMSFKSPTDALARIELDAVAGQ